MRVKYFIEIIQVLLEKGASQVEIAKTLGFSKQNLTEILGSVPEKQRQNLKDEHLPGLLKLCRKYKVQPMTAKGLIEVIERENNRAQLVLNKR